MTEAELKEKKKERSKLWYHNNLERAKTTRKKWRENNRDKQKEYISYWRENNEEQMKNVLKKYHLKSKYNLTTEERDNIFESQNHCCAICKTTCPTKNGWNVDHCHINNNVRGILCYHCNVGLGNFKDNIEALKEAIIYLEKGLK